MTALKNVPGIIYMNLPTIAVAECATCGAVAAEFGAVWGAAQYFKGGIICYGTSWSKSPRLIKTENFGQDL